MNNESGGDLISDLPLSIIHSILELVPIREAVRTSILSRQWRYTWATLPRLVFDDRCVGCSEEGEVDQTSLKNFITLALLLHNGPIHKFKLSSCYMEICPLVDQWLLFVSRNDVRELILDIQGSDLGYSSLYSCQNLTHLELQGSYELRPPPPTFKGFLCLRSLIIVHVTVPTETVESLVANSPLLENFTLQNRGGSNLRISAPNLKYFYVSGSYTEICLHAPLLAEMFLPSYSNVFRAGHLQKKGSLCNYTKFLGGFANLEKLSGGSSFTKYLSIGIESCHHSLVFHHLKVILLNGVIFQDIEEISVVVRLIMGAPNLGQLTIISSHISQNASEAPSISFWDSECAPNFTFKRLKVIKMLSIHGVLQEMKFVNFLLGSSPVLEKMIFKPHGRLTNQQLLNLTVELLRYRRASTNAEISFI